MFDPNEKEDDLIDMTESNVYEGDIDWDEVDAVRELLKKHDMN